MVKGTTWDPCPHICMNGCLSLFTRQPQTKLWEDSLSGPTCIEASSKAPVSLTGNGTSLKLAYILTYIFVLDYEGHFFQLENDVSHQAEFSVRAYCPRWQDCITSAMILCLGCKLSCQRSTVWGKLNGKKILTTFSMMGLDIGFFNVIISWTFERKSSLLVPCSQLVISLQF